MPFRLVLQRVHKKYQVSQEPPLGIICEKIVLSKCSITLHILNFFDNKKEYTFQQKYSSIFIY